MDEIHLWRWEYTDEFGKRRVTSWLMTEATVREFAHVYRGRGEGRRLAGDSEDGGLDQRLAALAIAVRVDRCFESSWELLGLFKDLTHEEASAKLVAWCRSQRIAAEFEIRNVRDTDVVFVILRAESSG